MALKKLEPVVECKEHTRPGVDVDGHVGRQEVVERSWVQSKVDRIVSVKSRDNSQGRDQESLDTQHSRDLVECRGNMGDNCKH